jgi:hypothetical protein
MSSVPLPHTASLQPHYEFQPTTKKRLEIGQSLRPKQAKKKMKY